MGAPFLRKGQYLGNEYHNVNVGSRENNDIERLHGRSMAGKEVKILSLTEQKDIIDASFASAAKAPKHPRKVGMKAKRVFSLLPDANIRPENASIVSFAQKPTEDSTQGAIIKGIENAPGGDDRAPVMYLLPKRQRQRQRRQGGRREPAVDLHLGPRVPVQRPPARGQALPLVPPGGHRLGLLCPHQNHSLPHKAQAHRDR